MIDQHIRAAAADWVARLASAERTEADETRFRIWLNEHPDHAAAFEEMMGAWEIAGNLQRAGAQRPVRSPFLQRRTVLAGAAALAAAGGLRFWYNARPVDYLTSPGEQRRLVLTDGTRVILDSATHLRVAMAMRHRDLVLFGGRAHFDVSPDPGRPFVVRADGRDVVATGTRFEVTSERRAVTVLLIEGSVVVRNEDVLTPMRAGDRLIFGAGNPQPARDRPDLDQLTAWQRGYLVLVNERLEDAVAEMSRYSASPLQVADLRLLDRRVSGTFTTADPLAFARSVALLLKTSLEVTPTKIVIGQSVAR